MFTILSWQHILMLIAVALVVAGPSDFPRFTSTLDKLAYRAISVAGEPRRILDDFARTAELDGFRAEMNALVKSLPLSDLDAAVTPPGQPRG